MSELLAARALTVLDPNGNGLAKRGERRGHLRERHPSVMREAPLAERPVLREQHDEDAIKVGHERGLVGDESYHDRNVIWSCRPRPDTASPRYTRKSDWRDATALSPWRNTLQRSV